MKKILCIFLFIPLTFTLIAQRYVSGYITDAENGNQPVVGASVFLSNTTIGDFTDAEGYYKLKIPEAGAYRLTISYVGYQSVFKEIEPGKTSLEFNTALHVSINELKEVTVTEKLRFRQRDIDLFWKTILGTSPSPKTIQVINPDKVYYYYNSKTGILKVTCREPLELNNYETGYHIHYVLDYFTYDYNKNIIDWSNQFNFTELKPENSKQESTWEKKRQEVYNLSLVKFIKSLYNNSLYDDGFVLATLSQDPSPNRSYQISLLNPESILSAKSADNGKTLNLSNQQVMLICYGRPVTANDLYMIQQTQSKGFYNGLVMNLLYGESIRIYPDGTYANKLQMAPVNISNTLLGLNMKLPINYHYEVIEFPAVENENTFDFDSIAKHFDAQMSVFPQEKLHLHTDRDFYAAGEKIWFKAYLTDAATLQPSINSRYVYVELINSRDSLINRVMIRPENDMFYGNLSISENVPEGDYTLRAYTRYMENLGDDYFFKKNIRIENLSSDKKQLFQTGQVNGREQNFKLPQSNPRAYTLTVSRQNKMLTVGVQKPAGSKNTPCYLLAQCRGEVFYFSAIQGIAGQARNDKVVQGIAGQARNDTMDQRVAGQAGNDVEFSEEELPAGVLQFVLFDEQMNPLSERLVFSKNYDCAKVEFHTNSETYKTRDHVIFSLSIVDSDGYPLAGNLSVAVTDD
ncbi:MAG: carboxypeptidase-like regulatory domain-containing protein, partial [Candidatus Azobacteroides sp.]|nr:carboxypeptidase-like regulatory domain-containing protein [Candidatus Azobacteroides sp.]